MSAMSVLVGTPSDLDPAMLAAGGTDITTLYVSMSARHPEGRDADYLEWHSLDHRPEQHRLATLRASFRLVSTAACRAARAAADARFDATDHLMTYLFTDTAGLARFGDLNAAMARAGRTPYLLPLVERSVYRLDGRVAAPRVKIGADVLPWWPARGVYVLVERVAGVADAGPASADATTGVDLIEAPGVAGAWWGGALPMDPPYTTTPNAGLCITYCFLDDDPVRTAVSLRPVLEARWRRSGATPLLAAPFHVIVPYDWHRHLP